MATQTEIILNRGFAFNFHCQQIYVCIKNESTYINPFRGFALGLQNDWGSQKSLKTQKICECRTFLYTYMRSRVKQCR